MGLDPHSMKINSSVSIALLKWACLKTVNFEAYHLFLLIQIGLLLMQTTKKYICLNVCVKDYTDFSLILKM